MADPARRRRAIVAEDLPAMQRLICGVVKRHCNLDVVPIYTLRELYAQQEDIRSQAVLVILDRRLGDYRPGDDEKVDEFALGLARPGVTTIELTAFPPGRANGNRLAAAQVVVLEKTAGWYKNLESVLAGAGHTTVVAEVPDDEEEGERIAMQDMLSQEVMSMFQQYLSRLPHNDRARLVWGGQSLSIDDLEQAVRIGTPLGLDLARTFLAVLRAEIERSE